jgi:hypothetical protein
MQDTSLLVESIYLSLMMDDTTGISYQTGLFDFQLQQINTPHHTQIIIASLAIHDLIIQQTVAYTLVLMVAYIVLMILAIQMHIRDGNLQVMASI